MKPVATLSKHSAKHLMLTLAEEGYGLPVHQVREIIRLQKITHVPNMPSCVKGVINLRGRIIPVVDLRTQLGLPAESNDRTCIIVVTCEAAGAPAKTTGLIVDRVEDVATIEPHEIEPAPALGHAVTTEYLVGMAKVRDGVKMLLNLERILSFDLSDSIPDSIALPAA